jgi:tetratricopeptide (TPR) repeat protein
MLHATGLEFVHSADSRETAMEALLNLPVDFILCDLMTENFEGFDFLRDVRNMSLTTYLPFMLMCGYGQMEKADYAVGKDLDVSGYVFKPISPKAMEDEIASTMKIHRASIKSFVHLYRAAAFLDVKDYDDARIELKTALHKGSRSSRIWNDSGTLFEDMGNDPEARMCYEASIKLDRNYAKPHSSIGQLLLKQNKTELACQYFRKAVSISPRSTERQFALAKALLDTGDIEGARLAVKRAVQGTRREYGSPEHQAVDSAAAAEFYLSAGYTDLAEEAFTDALKGDPENIHYYNRLGMTFRRQKQFQKSLNSYTKALDIAPEDTVILYNIALALAELGNYTSSATTLQKALLIDENFKDARGLLKMLEDKIGGPALHEVIETSSSLDIFPNPNSAPLATRLAS